MPEGVSRDVSVLSHSYFMQMVQARDLKCSVQAHPKHARETAVAVEDEVCHGPGTVDGVLLKAAVAVRVQRCWLVLICSDAEVKSSTVTRDPGCTRRTRPINPLHCIRSSVTLCISKE